MLKRAEILILKTLAEAADWTPASGLPDGNGRVGCVRGDKLKGLNDAGLIEYDRTAGDANNPYACGWRITSTGRTALEAITGEPGSKPEATEPETPSGGMSP